MERDPVLQLTMPPATYARLRERAALERRSIEEAALQMVDAGLTGEPALPPDLVATLTSMALLDDKALQQATRLRLPAAESALFAALNDKDQRDGLTQAERQVAEELAARHGRIVAMRAEAAALLHQRGNGHKGSNLATRT
jgi:plasmid stability protein